MYELLTLYPEIPETLDALRGAGIELAVATSKSTTSVTSTLGRLGVASMRLSSRSQSRGGERFALPSLE